MHQKVRVVADSRERNSGVIEALRKIGVLVVVRTLDVGDYIISERVAVERKRVQDFLNSIYDGRLFDQARRLTECYELPVMIVEGDLDCRILEPTKVNIVYGAMAKLALSFRLPLLFTPSPEYTAQLIYRIARHEQLRKKRPMALRRKKKLESIKDWQMYIVESLPGVGPTLAERLLRHFGSVRRIFEASSVELARVEGMGEARAREIVRILNAPFGRRESEEVQQRLELPSESGKGS